MAQFVKKYYNESEIVLNDIGTTSYFTNAKYLDIWGLANYDIVEYKLKNGDIDQDIVSRLAYNRNAEIAIIYSENTFDYVPIEWNKVASWTIKNRQVSNFATVYFYAINESTEELEANVRRFSKNLPPEISVEYYREEE